MSEQAGRPSDLMPTPEDMAVDLAVWLPSAKWHPVVLAAIRRSLAAEAECVRLRGIIDSLAARVKAQSDLLTARAEMPKRFRDTLLRLAASPCPSAPWVRQIVADALEITVEEMEMMLEATK